MTRRDNDRRLRDIEAAITAIRRHLRRGPIDDELIFDACRVRLIEIGEAVKDLDDALLKREQNVPWREIMKMRDRLTHRYFDTQHEVVADVVNNELPQLSVAVKQLRRHVADVARGQASLEEHQ